jgi:hypothetical protein
MTDLTARFALPLLHAGQAQKEMTHNEALLALDILLHPEVEALGENQPPPAPSAGQCWIVGDAPIGAWAGQADRIAAWSPAGWRFLRGCEAWCCGAATKDCPCGGCRVRGGSGSSVVPS